MTRRWGIAALAVAVTVGGWSGDARADVEIKFGGQIASDIRFRLGGEEVPPPGPDSVAPYPSQQRLLSYGFSRNENLIKAQLTLGIADKVKAVADVDFYWYGYSDVNDINSDTLHEDVDPYRLEANAAYVDVYKLLPHLDLRIGRQVVVWGTADKFNPTNNVNTLDLSGSAAVRQGAGQQHDPRRLQPDRRHGDHGGVDPDLPPGAAAAHGAAGGDAGLSPGAGAGVRHPQSAGHRRRAMPPNTINVATLQPDPSIQNSQVALRVAGRLLGIDAALSYYHGRWGIPTPAWASNKDNGVVDVSVMWPRMDVLGADVAGQIEKLNGLGYWVEGAVIFPQEVTYGVYNDEHGMHTPITFKDGGTKDSNGNEVFTQQFSNAFQRGTVVPSTPFVKLTAGIDYTWNKYLYSNLQYVYGFIDEFGAGKQCFAVTTTIGDTPRCEARIGHYLVVGSDIKLFSDQLLLRFFGAFKIPQYDDQPNPYTHQQVFTAVLFPQVAWAVWDATELSVGGFIFLGDRDTKFGDPAAGASEIFMKARFTY